MLVLLGIAFVAGVITAISPCVLPVLPIVLAGSAAGGPRRPYAVIAGLVLSFAVFTLFASVVLDWLGLPQDFLRNLAIALLFVVAATLLFPRLTQLVERPLIVLRRAKPSSPDAAGGRISSRARRPSGDLGGGFLLGASLGLVYVPCAGPVLAAISVLAATRRVDGDAVLVAFAYALGAALPMLAIAVAGQQAVARTQALKRRLAALRPTLGLIVAGATLAIVFNVDRTLATTVPGYTSALQQRVEESDSARLELGRLTEARGAQPRAIADEELADFGPAPDFVGISHWLNTRGGRPLSLRGLRGKVVLVDFWTYSCINCLRTLPYLKAWHRAYAPKGLAIVGVHSPEFAFERVLANVRGAVRDLGLRYPIALDDRFATWNAYSNQYWPAKYLIDVDGHVRFAHFGEGHYDEIERLIRGLLTQRRVPLPSDLKMPDRTPVGPLTPESYLGYVRLARYANPSVRPDRMARYDLPRTLPRNWLAYGGFWRVEHERAVALRDARLLLNFRARDVHLVLGGRGTVAVFLNGKRVRRVRVVEDRLYTLLEQPETRNGLLLLRFTPNVMAYAFTFG